MDVRPYGSIQNPYSYFNCNRFLRPSLLLQSVWYACINKLDLCVWPFPRVVQFSELPFLHFCLSVCLTLMLAYVLLWNWFDCSLNVSECYGLLMGYCNSNIVTEMAVFLKPILVWFWWSILTRLQLWVEQL